MPIVLIFSRWLHIVSACIALGGIFFLRLVLPAGLSRIDPESAKSVLAGVRRIFKPIMHSAILFFLLTGAFNTWKAWNLYTRDPALIHPLWGTHVLLGLIAICIVLYVLSGKEYRPNARKWMAINLVILLLAIATATTLKWARETHAMQPTPQPVPESPR